MATGLTFTASYRSPGRAIGSALQGGESLALYGPLGSGKTALVRGIAAGLGALIQRREQPHIRASPRISRTIAARPCRSVSTQFTQRGGINRTGDYLSGSTVVVIEWADKAPGILPPDRLEMQLRHRTVQSRSIRLMATGPLSAALLARTKTTRSPRRPRSGRPRSASAKGLPSR